MGSEPLPADEFRDLAAGGWRRLTALRRKAALFLRDSYFRRSWADFESCFGPAALETAGRLGAILFKPESFLADGGVLRIAARVEAFAQLRHVEPLSIDRRTAHDLWRYQWDGATLDRIDLACAAVAAGTAAYTLWIADGAALPLCVRLSRAKGARQPSRREPGSFRCDIGCPDMMLTGLHVPDEPADLVRELGVLFDNGDRHVLLGRVADRTSSLRPRALLTELASRCEAQRLDRNAAVERISRLARSGGSCLAGVSSTLDAIGRGEKVSLSAAQAVVAAAGAVVPPWDKVLFLSHAIRHDFPDRVSTIADSGASLWPR